MIPKWHEIPEDARHALEAAMDASGVDYGVNTADYYISAVWPHLYAAALRHAADEVDADAPFEGVRAQRVIRQASSKLRRLADEATS